MKVEGHLFGWFETGLEGTVWALQEKGKERSYDGLHVLKPGDRLTIFKATKEVYPEFKHPLCEVLIEPDFKTGIPKGEKQQVANGLWVHWIQKGWQPNAWGLLFSAELPAILERHDEKVVLRKKQKPSKRSPIK